MRRRRNCSSRAADSTLKPLPPPIGSSKARSSAQCHTLPLRVMRRWRATSRLRRCLRSRTSCTTVRRGAHSSLNVRSLAHSLTSRSSAAVLRRFRCVTSAPVVLPPPRGFRLGEVHIDPFRSFRADFASSQPHCTPLHTAVRPTPPPDQPARASHTQSAALLSACPRSAASPSSSSSSSRPLDKFLFSPPVGQLRHACSSTCHFPPCPPSIAADRRSVCVSLSVGFAQTCCSLAASMRACLRLRLAGGGCW